MRELHVAVPIEFEECVLDALEGECQIKNITRMSDGLTSRLTCFVAAQECGVVLHELDKVGCGTAYGKVALLPVQLLKPLPTFKDRHLTTLVKQMTWGMRGRMATEEIYTGVASGTDLSFDYLAFIGVAGLIASVGLAVNSSVMIVASMLVSPLMGPILAFSFGTSVQDFALIKKGLLAEGIGVAATFAVGFIVGLVVSAWTTVAFFYSWPTDEMLSRGEASGLLVGVFFAVPSGAGVALSTTQGGTNALVGVAIAASLLPPIANCGMNLAFAAVGAPKCRMDQHEFFRISWMSFVLFLINVGCIYVVCIFFFWIKNIKKVRRQLSTYRDMPPVRAKFRPAPGQRGRTVSDGGASRGGGSGSGTQQALESGSVAIQMTGAKAGLGVGIKRTGIPQAPGGSGKGNGAGNGAGTGTGTGGSNRGVREKSDTSQKKSLTKTVSNRLAGVLGPFLHGQMSGQPSGGLSGSTGNRSSVSGTPSQAPSEVSASGRLRVRSKGSRSGLRGWQRVRKVVLEDKAIDKAIASGTLQEGPIPEELV